jgi:hypothetical protein
MSSLFDSSFRFSLGIDDPLYDINNAAAIADFIEEGVL